MTRSTQDDNIAVPPEGLFARSTAGIGKEHKNVSDDAERQVLIRIGAFIVDADRSVLPPEGTFEEPDLLAAPSAVEGVECVVDTGATISIFRTEIARKLGLEPDSGEIESDTIEAFGDHGVKCCRCRHVIHLDVGPYPIPVPVRFPVKPVKEGTAGKYEWDDDFPLGKNILGMESVLARRVLCFTPDYLYAFEHRP